MWWKATGRMEWYDERDTLLGGWEEQRQSERYNEWKKLVFNVHGSLNHKNILTYIQLDATLHSLFYLETTLHISGCTTTHHQERMQLYLQHLVFVTPLLFLLLLPGTEIPSWRFWPSERPLSTSLDPGRRLSSFWSSFGRCPVWCYLPICTWVFLVIFLLEVSN